MMRYAALWTKSNFSFLEGASHPEELVETAEQLGVDALALTDRDGVYGIVEAHVKARELGMRLIVGAEMTVEDGSSIVLLAMDREGYAELCALITTGRRRSPKGESLVTWREVCAHAPRLIALWGGDRSLLAGETEPVFIAHDLRDAFGDRLYALAARHRRAEEARAEARLRERAKRYGMPVVAAVEVLYHRRVRRDLQDVLTCIRHGVPLSAIGRRTKPNAEHALKSPHDFARLFADDLDAIELTREVAERCRFSLDEIRYTYPAERLPDGMSSSDWLRNLTYDGARARAKSESIPAAMRAQLDRELSLIDELEYCGYFLTMWEIVRYCREHDILCQGRGSAANSAVCYCLGITAVDPIQMGLLFERFLSRERAEPPDIDLDIEHNRREEVIQHVYEKYGRTHAAMVANVIRYRTRSAIRDVGKALGVDAAALDRLAKLSPHYGELHPDFLASAGFARAPIGGLLPVHAHLVRLANEIIDFPRHLSIHPGGFVLGSEPVSSFVPVENASMEKRTVIQWDKDSIEELGIFKVDLLALGSLTQLHLGFDMLREQYGRQVSMSTIPADDEATFDMICRGDTVGVFQIESRAQMAMLPRLRPRNYYDLVIEVSIVRPGPITGGMVHPYLRRRAGEEEIVYPHECLEPVLKKTLGVPLFQEQVIRLAMVAADYTPGEADQLRRDMAAWRKTGRIERHRVRLVSRMERKGIAREFAERVFEQIRGFGEYGFPESHAASFALIAYAAAWLKCHHPDVFAASLLNALPMGFYSAATIIDDAKRHRVEVRDADVTWSDWHCTLEPRRASDSTRAVRVGLRFIKGMREHDWRRIEAARAERFFEQRPFLSIDDFSCRTGLEDGAMTRLAEAGAFASLESNRREALWEAKGLAKLEQPRLEIEIDERDPGFDPLDELDDVAWDYDAMGLSARRHPLEPFRAELTRRRIPSAEALRGMKDGSQVNYAGLVICRQRPGTAAGVVFMTLEDETGFANLIVWSRIFEKNTLLIKTSSFLGVTGKLQTKDGVTHVIASRFWKPKLSRKDAAGEETAGEPRSVESRDFH